MTFQNFPLFRSHLDLAHHYWQRLLKAGDWVIDATCGNGNDTLKLAEILFFNTKSTGGIIGIDIQETAIDQTKALLTSRLSLEHLTQIYLFCQSHVEFPSLAFKHPIRLIVYNLGYLPKGDKKQTTTSLITIRSIRKALDLVVPGGTVCVTCYPGHEEGAKEEKALLKEIPSLSPITWNICHHTFPNRRFSPSLFLLQKSK